MMQHVIDYDEFGPEKILGVYDPKTGMRGFVVIDNTALGPGKGGIRMTPTVTVEEVFRLARTMTWKNALAGLPFGGAKSGIIADAKKISPAKKEAIVKAFSKGLEEISPVEYIAAPDMNMAEQEMAWYVDANGDKKSATGKPKSMGGLPHELGSTGFGVFHSAMIAAERAGLDPTKATVAIEGFGNVGWFAAKFLSGQGCQLVAVSDSKGAVHSHGKAINFDKLADVKKRTGSVTNYKPGDTDYHESILEVGADVLITAAVPDLIEAKDVRKLKFKVIVEGSNIPMTHDVEQLIHKKGIIVVPDFVANAGGVISSYVEHKGGTEKEMFKLIEKKIKENTHHLMERCDIEKVDPRTCALNIAKERIREKEG
jgi:glutamate dehydrogenase/leucine dehydrogenase